jgi:catechol 2,3-dioxygenase-like lactoylglutathione lyase family enzyme
MAADPIATSLGVHVTRAGTILAVTNVDNSVAFYVDKLGFSVDATYDDPPYATLTRAGMRLSLAEQGHPAEDRPGIAMTAPTDPSNTAVVLVLEVEDCMKVYERLGRLGVTFLAEPYHPPWGGHRFFCVDPDGYLVEIEELA